MNYAAETSLGVVTIRAFKMMDRFFENYLELVDTDAKLFFFSNAAIEWLILRVEMLQNLTIVTAALLLVVLPKGDVDPGIYNWLHQSLFCPSVFYSLSKMISFLFLHRAYGALSFLCSVTDGHTGVPVSMVL